MRAIDLITDEIPPLMHTDTGEKALSWMEEFKVSHLPVLKDGNFVGLVSEAMLFDQTDLSQSLDKLFQHLPRPFSYVGEHIYQVLARISEYQLSLIPILDNDEQYVGCSGVHHLLTLIANTGSIKEVGGILVVEMSSTDYSMAQIGQIVESNDAKILSAYLMSSTDSTNVEVTLKINTLDLDRIISTFERYDYVIKASFQKSRSADDLQFRYDALLNYLNL
ncbi:MAG: acetoin utilization protein AcuB [Flavobacteriaceae bacterium]|jgi:acetoin utilization protein AcuB